MGNTTTTTTDESITRYNAEAEAMLEKSIRWGSMQRPKSTLAEIAGVATNDNQEVLVGQQLDLFPETLDAGQ
jgi:hypothetical protein